MHILAYSHAIAFKLTLPEQINALEIATRRGAKLNTIQKRFSQIKARYGLNIQTTSAGAKLPPGSAPVTPIKSRTSNMATGNSGNRIAKRTPISSSKKKGSRIAERFKPENLQQAMPESEEDDKGPLDFKEEEEEGEEEDDEEVSDDDVLIVGVRERRRNEYEHREPPRKSAGVRCKGMINLSSGKSSLIGIDDVLVERPFEGRINMNHFGDCGEPVNAEPVAGDIDLEIGSGDPWANDHFHKMR